MKIFLVDDNDNFRTSLKIFLEGHLQYEIIGEANNGKTFMEMNPNGVDIILMDINMPELGGMETTKMSMWKNRNLKIIAVSQYKDSVDLEQLIGVGYKGFVSKTNLYRDLENAIRIVSKGGFFFPDELEVERESN